MQILASEAQAGHPVLPAAESDARLRAVELTNTSSAGRRGEAAHAERQGAVCLSAARAECEDSFQLSAQHAH